MNGKKTSTILRKSVVIGALSLTALLLLALAYFQISGRTALSTKKESKSGSLAEVNAPSDRPKEDLPTDSAATLRKGNTVAVSFSDSNDGSYLLKGDFIISESGHLKLPHFPEAILAAGLSDQELQSVILKKSREFEAGPDLRVTADRVIISGSLPVVTVFGEVNTPTECLLRPDMKLLDAVSKAGGFAQTDVTNKVRLIRANEVWVFEAATSAQSGKENNPRLKDGDVIEVLKSSE